jgi:hypothetical protein
MFTPNKHSPNVIHILPKSLEAYHLDEQFMINSSDNNQEHNQGQTEHEHQMHYQLDETKNFAVVDSPVSFTRMFQYLSSLISYNLHEDNDIIARIAAENATLGTLKDYGATTILTCTANISSSEPSQCTSFYGTQRPGHNGNHNLTIWKYFSLQHS